MFQSHSLSITDFSAAICGFTSAENSPLKMYRSVWNIYVRKYVASSIWKKSFHFHSQNCIGRFLGLERKPLCTSTTWQFHLALPAVGMNKLTAGICLFNKITNSSVYQTSNLCKFTQSKINFEFLKGFEYVTKGQCEWKRLK